MKLNAMTASQFADEIGVQRSSISHILSARNKPSLEFIQKVINRFPKVDSTWLINGKTNIGTVPEIETKKVAELNPTESITVSQEESEKPTQVPPEAINDPLLGKQIKKILVFYSDGTFEEIVK
jgi:transcriptional regulator with XRE-family HTH domain